MRCRGELATFQNSVVDGAMMSVKGFSTSEGTSQPHLSFSRVTPRLSMFAGRGEALTPLAKLTVGSLCRDQTMSGTKPRNTAQEHHTSTQSKGGVQQR